jgi:hypothetical protein
VDDNVHHLRTVPKDASKGQTPEELFQIYRTNLIQGLEAMLKEVKEGGHQDKCKAVLVLLDDRDERYSTAVSRHGLYRSETAALLDHAKIAVQLSMIPR